MIKRFLLHRLNKFPFKSILICLCVLAGASVFGLNLMFTYDKVLEQVLMSIFCACVLVICFCLGLLLINAIIAIVIPKYYDEIFKAIFDIDKENSEYIKNHNNIVEFKRYR